MLAGIPMISRTTSTPATCRRPGWWFDGSFPRSDAFVARKLRQPGDHPGKATMTEFANFLTNGCRGLQLARRLWLQPGRSAARPACGVDALLRPFNDGRPARRRAAPVRGRESRSPPTCRGRHRHRDVRLDPQPGTPAASSASSPRWLISRDGIIPITADQQAGPLARP